MRKLGRIPVRLLARVEVHGLERFPTHCPLIVVGNHTGAMEVVLLTIYAPRLVEYLGSVDIPHEGYIAAFIYAYGFIPVFRGKTGRASLEAGLDVLRQGGVLGVFPEGGIWEPGTRRAQAGVAWLSYRSGASVLPIGFGSTRGVLREMIRLRRPRLTMHIGEPLPPVELTPGLPRKTVLQQAADRIVDATWALVPDDEQSDAGPLLEEAFSLEVTVIDRRGDPVKIPPALELKHGHALRKVIHRTVLFNNFLQNLRLPVEALRDLQKRPHPDDLLHATGAILDYLENDNPYYFTYRYGLAEGSAMGDGVREFHALLRWACTEGYAIHAAPVRRVRHPETGEFHTYLTPQETEKW